MSSTLARRIVHVTKGMPAEDGAGVKLTRLVGTPELPDLDPMLMLDTFRTDDPNDYGAGFPAHPHRGFETVSYMIRGRLQHRDNKGGTGLVTDGGVQWMTAGRGVVHSEMPAQTDGAMFGFQLWLNLPARDKMSAPWYRDIPAADIPTLQHGGADIKLIAGKLGTARGPGPDRPTAPLIADVTAPANGEIAIPIPDGHNAFFYVFEGVLAIGDKSITKGELVVLSDLGELKAKASAQGARLLLVAGKPLREPIAKYGPFVMNTQAELRQALNDYQRGLF